MPGPTQRPHILSLGTMYSTIVEALSANFELHSDRDTPRATILAHHAADITAVISKGGIPIDAALINALPNLRLITLGSVGYDSVDVPAALARTIVVTNTPDVLTDEMADFTIGLLIATIRRIPQLDAFTHAGQWPANRDIPLTTSLRGRTIGIAGLGRIGAAVARRIEGFGLPIAYYARHRRTDLPYRHHADLLGLAKAVDTLIVLLPGGDPTRGAVNAEILQALGRDGVLINVARGSVVDEPALIAALQSNTIAAAGLDVFANEPNIPQPLLDLPQVVLTPHAGTATHHTRALMAGLMLRNLQSWFAGAGPVTPIPECAAISPRPWPPLQ